MQRDPEGGVLKTCRRAVRGAPSPNSPGGFPERSDPGGASQSSPGNWSSTPDSRWTVGSCANGAPVLQPARSECCLRLCPAGRCRTIIPPGCRCCKANGPPGKVSGCLPRRGGSPAHSHAKPRSAGAAVSVQAAVRQCPLRVVWRIWSASKALEKAPATPRCASCRSARA